MIEFTPDGPFAQKADNLFPDRVRVIGLGQTGVSVADQLVLHGQTPDDLWVFDSDQQTIEASIVPNRHLLGRDLVHGLGCGGDDELAREIVALEEERIAPLGHECDFLILMLSLSGSTGVAMANHLAQLGRAAGAKVIVVGVLPFAFEGWVRREKAVQALNSLRQLADSVLVLAHDRVSENPAALKNVRHGFHLMHKLLSQSVQALAQVVCKRGLVQLSFADVRSLYGRYAGSEVLENCWLGHVAGDVNSNCEELVSELLAGPLLSDESTWKHVDHAIVTVNGSDRLGLADVQELIGALKDKLPANLPLAVSASLDDEGSDRVSMTLLLAMTAPVTFAPCEPVAPAAPVATPLTKTTALPVVPIKVKLGTEAAPEVEPIAPAAPIKTRVQPVAKPVAKPITVKSVPALAEKKLVNEDSDLAVAVASTNPRIPAKQEEMIFEGPTRGRFEKTHETIYRGENLDVPTFRRRRLAIRV